MIALPEGLREEEAVAYLRRAGIAERTALSPEEPNRFLRIRLRPASASSIRCA